VHVQLDFVGWCAKRQVEADFVPLHQHPAQVADLAPAWSRPVLEPKSTPYAARRAAFRTRRAAPSCKSARSCSLAADSGIRPDASAHAPASGGSSPGRRRASPESDVSRQSRMLRALRGPPIHYGRRYPRACLAAIARWCRTTLWFWSGVEPREYPGLLRDSCRMVRSELLGSRPGHELVDLHVGRLIA
jgi:hypothetical protein